MTLYNNFLLKRGVGLFSRVGLISGDYGILLVREQVSAMVNALLNTSFISVNNYTEIQ